MSSVLEYIDQNPQEAQRLVGLKYEQLKKLITKTEELHSDINLWKERQKKFAPQQRFQGDKAYVGYQAIKTPQKKPKKKQLSLAEKGKNKELAKKRIFVEHLIRLVKIWRIAQERFRLNSGKYEQIVLTVCGLVRLRIKSLILSG